MKDYAAYLFDMDGTLVDSEKLKGRALSETCRLHGGDADIETYREVMGEKWEVVTAHFFRVAGIDPDLEQFNADFRKRYSELLFNHLETNKNVISLLKKLNAKNKKTGLVSSASKWMVDHALEQLKLSSFFDVVVCKEDVSRHKPYPDSFLLAISKLGVSPSETLIFEDSAAGLISAQKAGCDAVVFRHDFKQNNDLGSAVKIISNFDEIEIYK